MSVVQPDGSERPADVVEQFGTQFLVRTDADRSYVFRLRAEWDGVPSTGFTDVAVTTPPRLESSVTLATPQPVPAGDTSLQFEVRTFGANVTGTHRRLDRRRAGDDRRAGLGRRHRRRPARSWVAHVRRLVLRRRRLAAVVRVAPVRGRRAAARVHRGDRAAGVRERDRRRRRDL